MAHYKKDLDQEETILSHLDLLFMISKTVKTLSVSYINNSDVIIHLADTWYSVEVIISLEDLS